MTEIPKLGYLLPEFPGQAHSLYWREILKLEAMGIEAVLFSDRPTDTAAHAWAKGARQRTEYLAQGTMSSLMSLPKLPWRQLKQGSGNVERMRAVSHAAPAAKQLAKSCEAQGVTHVHVASCGPVAMIAALANHLYELDYSISLHGPLSEGGIGQKFKWQSAKFAIVGSQRLLDEITPVLGESLPERVLVQPQGVDTDHLRRDAPYRPPEPGKTLRLVSRARLHASNAHEDLFQAVTLLQGRGIDVHLEIIGEDDEGGTGYRTVLEEQITELGLIGTVRLMGSVSEDTLRDRLCDAHVFVMANHSEALGASAMEAMSCECPVVGIEGGSVDELITNGRDGVLVEKGNPVALAAALEYLATDPVRAAALGQAGRKRILQSFDAARGAEALVREVGLTPPPMEPMPDEPLLDF
ncbi:GDP-mannose-dependent alpha-(1-6)-phosphatidylinositol monomannoside mannosyltransferase [Thalassovita autumnalis]|uniref:GDP-mannose-dependent alpha-(1-6)-phosphatidylinositol monomannoside mannosyltransferase n=1 Tax=Thalassovita autumnalis TaxID=2072972 RepID=A0A0P1FEP8_9RHOB|nr:exopolysaccharide biosynthesis GT4 family glycosyltransferase EpsE [Thalassovita autumnalis]CUH66583.1 GDP-mannose-dependent alpha-(1-6)-phosphatidylinositol monomannoside mannosyltransferase [Thalassovita autumnalis]CUH71278.1 GDP-mannose-dependent alpha-(1-6)-phosphatidylinositol monomannoside mannosyltransferase [Thalassovita autumnalis]